MTRGQKAQPAVATQPDAFDPQRIDKAKDLLHCLANSVSAMKIFPSEHATVRNFVDQLTAKFGDFLAAYDKLQIGIEEYSFTYGGKPAYTDEVAIKSLPFFFFKDGLQILFFYQGLDRAEILEFLELIKAEAQKPAEDADIVVALWERDFPNIQYYAPGRIPRKPHPRLKPVIPAPSGTCPTCPKISPTRRSRSGSTPPNSPRAGSISTGRTVSRSKEPPPGAAERKPRRRAAGSERPKWRFRARGAQISPAAAMDPTLTEAELHALETMVRANRTISAEEEYINLMVEIVFLEENINSCQASLDALLEYHFDQLQRGQFQVAVLMIQKVHELARHLDGNPAKAALLDEFLKRTVSPKTVEAIKTLLAKKKKLDWESLLGFFGLLGPPSLGLAADLFDVAPDGEARHKIMAFIERTGASHPALLAELADSGRPLLARADHRHPVPYPRQPRHPPSLGCS